MIGSHFKVISSYATVGHYHGAQIDKRARRRALWKLKYALQVRQHDRQYGWRNWWLIWKKSTIIPTLYIDNTAAEELSKTWKPHSKAKHIEIREMFIRNDTVLRNRLIVKHISSRDNIADGRTQQLPKDQFLRHMHGFGMTTNS